MKISAYHKNRGDWVHLNKGVEDPDKVYISCIFKKNGPQALGIAKFYPKSDVKIGGSGVNYKTLPSEIEYIMPDYDLYGIDYSMGFTSRGCIRKCEFCIVPEKEGRIRANQSIEEFLHPNHKKVVLLDNNLLAAPNHKETLKYLADTRLMVSFTQGNDIRLVNEDNANLLAETKYYDFDFKARMLYFAWDWMELEDKVERGIQTLKDAGIKGYQLTFYILMGFNTTLEQDRYRAEKLHEWGAVPYAMPYNSICEGEFHDLVREVNRKWIWYKKHPRNTTQS